MMRRVHSLDIEVDWNRIEQPDFKLVVQKGSSPIQMIGCFDSFKNKYYSFFYHKEVVIKKKETKLKTLLKKQLRTNHFNVIDSEFISTESGTTYDCRYLFFNNEKTMLKSYIKFIKITNPDIWHGANIEEFDLVYIINRCKTLYINYKDLSPLGETYVAHGKATIRGSIIYDLFKDYAKWQGSHRHANSLKKLAETHLKTNKGKKITKTSTNILDEDWYTNKKDWKKFVEYCLVDVELCVLLEKQLGFIETNNRMEKFSGVNPMFVRYASNMIESLFSFIKPIYEKEILNNEYKIAFDTNSTEQLTERAAGAVVLDNKARIIYDGLIILLDLSKMYPETIRSLNVSPETLKLIIEEKEKDKYIHCIANDVYYKKEPMGFIPFCFKILYEIRNEVERERDKHQYGSKRYKEINDKRQTIKDSINAVSGQFDYYKSIFVKPVCANSYRLTGRLEIKETEIHTYMFGEKVKIELEIIYGDTDSVYVHIKNITTIEEAKIIGKEICKWIQTGYDKLAKEMNIDDHKFSIGLEAILDVYLSIGKKKKYFGHLLWVDGNLIDEDKSLYVKGFETRRSDSSDLTDRAQKEIFSLICKIKKLGKKKLKEQIKKKIRNDYMNEFNEENILTIGIPQGIKKPLDKYKVTNPWRDGCLYSNKYLNTNFGMGSKPKMVYIKEVLKGEKKFPHTNSICIDEGMIIPEGYFVIDREKMIQKTVLDKLKDVLSVIEIDETEILEGFKQIKVSDFLNKINIDKSENKKINLDELINKSNEELIEYRKSIGLTTKMKEIELIK